MKNKNILLSDLLVQREIEVIMESVREIDLAAAKEKGKEGLKQAGATAKELGTKLKQATQTAIKTGTQKAKETTKKIQDSPQFQGIKDEIAKELKDPKKTKAVANGILDLLMKASEIFKSTMKSEQKRKMLKTLFANKLLLLGGVAGKVWDVIRIAVEKATTIHYDGVLGFGGFDKAGTQLGDPLILDFLGDMLPYMIALRAILAIYDIRGTFKAAVDVGKSVGKFAKDARDIVKGKDTTNETLNEDEGPDLEDIAFKAIDMAI